MNRQPWRFIVIQDKKIIGELAGIARLRIKKLHKLIPLLRPFSKDLKDQRVVNAIKKTVEAPADKDTVFYNAPLIIFIANDTRLGLTKEDCHLAAQNMVLAAHSLGIGSCYVGRGKAIPKKVLREK